MRRAIVSILVAVCAGVFAPAAMAHAVLESTKPARGETLKAQPRLITFGFSEPVESSFGAVRVYNAKGNQVQSGEVTHPGGQSFVAIGLRPRLAQGSYTATFRVISADSHPVSGGFVFSIGKAGATPKTVAQLTAADKVGRITAVSFGVARGVSYAAIAFAIGALAFLILIWLPALRSVAGADHRWLEASERFSRRLHALLVVGLAAGLVGQVCQIVFQGATATGGTFWSALDGTVIREVIRTRFGTVHLIDAIAFAAFLLVAVPRRSPVLRPAAVGATGLAARGFGRVELGLMGGLAALLAISPALSGHAETQSPSGLLIPLDALHVSAMSVWVGGLAVLIGVLPVATRALEPSDRTRLLAATLLRFSPVALAAVCAILASGLVQAYVHVRSIDNLINTGYGRAVLAKMVLLAVLIGFGYYNRQRGVPRLQELAAGNASPGAAGVAIRRSLRAEVLLLAVVIGVTSLLVSYAPANVTSATGPFARTTTLGPTELQMTVDPAATGSNLMHFYLINAKDGSQFDGSKEFSVLMSLPDKNIGPLKAEPRKAGPGHYVVLGASFVPGGKWKVQVVDRVSAFDEYQTTVDVPIR
jgi:copper transport protein